MPNKVVVCLILLVSLPSYTDNPKGVVIVVHGTWASENIWWKPTGEFFDTVEQTAKKMHKKVVAFSWPAKLTHESRFIAARSLAKLIVSYPLDYTIDIICHSHGSNVTLIAAQLLALDSNNKHIINTCYCLATPVDQQQYWPNMHIINHLYNIFSLQDWVQTVFGTFDRVFPDHKQITNIRIYLNNVEPGHTEFKSPLLAHWLLKIPTLVQQTCAQASKPISFPGILKLYDDKLPNYLFDMNQLKLLEQDKVAMDIALQNIVRYKKGYNLPSFSNS